MAVTWERISPGFDASRMLRGYQETGTWVERWRGRGLPMTLQPDGVTRLTSLEMAYICDGAGATGTIPPALSAPHPEIPNCIVLFKRILRAPAQGKVTIQVIYGPAPWVGYTGGPRLYGNPSAEFIDQWIPLIQQVSAGVWLESDRGDRPPTFNRLRSWRRRPKLITGDPDLIADQIEPNIGRLYTFSIPVALPPFPPVIPWVLASYNFAASNAAGQFILTYTFFTLAPVKPMPANTFPGQGVALPALGWLEEYTTVVSGSPPTVGIMTAGQRYYSGEPLP